MNVVFFGASQYTIPLIEQLKKHFSLALVVTTEQASTQPLTAFCRKGHIPYLAIKQFNNETIEEIKKTNTPLAVLAYFGLILPQNLLGIFPKGIINIHPSLLPKYRGATPVQTAIVNGDTKTGVTIIKLDEQVDHGPILAQEEVTIDSSDTAHTLHQKLFTLGASLCSDVLIRYYKGAITPIPQDDAQATFTTKLTRASGYIDLSSLEIENLKLEIARKIRAYYPWPGTWTKLVLNGKERIVKLLPGNMIQVEGKKPMTYKNFFNGYPAAEKQLLALLH